MLSVWPSDKDKTLGTFLLVKDRKKLLVYDLTPKKLGSHTPFSQQRKSYTESQTILLKELR